MNRPKARDWRYLQDIKDRTFRKAKRIPDRKKEQSRRWARQNDSTKE